MIIEQSSLPVVEQPKRQNYFWPLVLGTIITLTATTLPILFVVVKNDRPTGTLLSPIPEGVVTENRKMEAPKPLSSETALLLAQNYLSKAYELLRSPDQTETDKAFVKASLDQALRQTENSIRLSPGNPETENLRLQILAEIKKILPGAVASDSTGQKLVIAAPGEDSSSSATTNMPSNASQNRFILPAGQTEMTIKNTQVKTGSYIYLLPVENGESIVSLKTKTAGSFTISADIPSETDLPIFYYIINE